MEHRTSNRYAVDGAGQELPTLMEMQTIRRLRKVYSDNLTSYLIFDLKTGPLEHKLLAGYNYIQSITPQGASQQTAGGYRNAANTGVITGRYNSTNRSRYLLDAQGHPVPNVPHFNLANPNYSIANTNTYFLQSTPINPQKYYVNGIYLQDQIQWGRAQLLLGLRQEFYTSWLNYKKDTGDRRVTQEALIPRVGVVFALTDQLNAYGTYVQGYQPQVAATIGSPEIFGGPFDPLTSVMWEGGLKGEFLNKRLAASVAAYQIEQNNVLVNARNPDNIELLEQRGQERARGVELDVLGRITPDWSLTANYAFNRTIIIASINEQEVGRTKENAPRHAGGLWTKYTISAGALEGFGVGLGANFVTRRNTFSPLLTLPGYSVFDAAVY